MKNTDKKGHKLLKLVNTPIKRVSAFALATIIGVGSIVTVMAATEKATIMDNGIVYWVSLNTTNTDELLAKANVELGANDIVERDDSNGVVIKVRREIDATVEADGSTKVINAHYGDKLGDIVAKAGVTLDDNDIVSADLDSELQESANLVVTRQYKVTVEDNGTTRVVDVPEGTVANVITAANITLGDEDTLSVAETEPVTEGMVVTVNRVTYATQTVTEDVPFETETKQTASLYKGETKVETAGVNGTKTAVKECKFVNGELVQSKDVAIISETAPVAEVKLVGTKEKPVANATATAASTANTSKPQTGTISGNTITDANGNTLNVSRVITGQCTAYTGGGITATGAPAAVGRVAVNPNVIPYGTRLYIASPDGSVVYGYAIASDTGGAMMSGRVLADLYYNTESECINFGRRTMNIYVLG